MIVGYLRPTKTPRHFAKVMAIMCMYRGIDFIYFNPDGVDTKLGQVTGKVLSEDEWKEKTVKVPKFIDVAPTLFTFKRYQKILEYLSQQSTLSINKRMPLPKNKIEKSFKSDSDISKYLIPSSNIKSFDDISNFINIHGKIVLKPVRSNQGKNVYVLSRKSNNYIIGFGRDEENLTEDDLKQFYYKQIENVKFISQKYIESRDFEGNPVDCRIHVEKNIRGKWENVNNFVRIGVGQKVISNISQGGGIMPAKKFLKIKYGDDWKRIYNEITKIATILPLKIEKKLGIELMTLGFDIGLDPDGNLFLFEINDHPLVTPSISQITLTRSGYYKYKLKEINRI